MKRITILFFAGILILFVLTGCSVRESSTTPPITVTSPIITPSAPTTTPSSQSPLLFDFDSGTTPPKRSQSTPFEYTRDGVTAYFSSPSDPAAFSIQNHESTSLVLSSFSGNYLMKNYQGKAILIIKFNQPIREIQISFATGDYHGPGNIEIPSNLQLSAYLGSPGKTSAGSVTTHGEYSSDSFPQGTLSFQNRTNPFDVVSLELLFQPGGAAIFLIDNISVYLQVK